MIRICFILKNTVEKINDIMGTGTAVHIVLSKKYEFISPSSTTINLIFNNV